MVSSGIIIFGLKQSSELACNPGMLGSWDIFLRKAGLKKLQMLSRWPRVYWKWFWPSSKGLLGPAMRFWGHLLGWAFPKIFLWVIRHSSAGADTEMCSLVLGWEKEKSWVKISVLEGAESAKGKVSKQGVKSDVLLTFCLISILSIWSAKFCFSEMVEVRTELGQFPAACWLALGLVLFFFSFFLLAAGGDSAVDSGHVADTWCCLMEDYHPIAGWFLENALCCTDSVRKGPECKYLIWKQMLLWGNPSGEIVLLL